MKFTKGVIPGYYYNFNIHNHVLAIDTNRSPYRLFYKKNKQRDTVIVVSLLNNTYYYIR